jgi:hypothetical protein
VLVVQTAALDEDRMFGAHSAEAHAHDTAPTSEGSPGG